MKSKVFLILFISQIILIAVLIGVIYKKASQNNISLNPINSRFVELKKDDVLHFFYEPRASITETVRRDWLSYTPTYRINKDSLNERYDYAEKKDGGVFRIITLGDSFTFGAYVDTEANWTELLEDYLNKKYMCPAVTKYEVINLGMDGYDTAYEVEKYVRRGEKYDPDLMIMLVTDFGRVTEHRLSRKRAMPTLTVKEREEYRKKGNYYADTNRFDGELSHKDRVEYQKKHFGRLMSIYTNPLLFVDFSLNDSYASDITNLTGQYKSVKLVHMKLMRNDKRYILPDWHPNRAGHKKIMEEMVEHLTDSVLLPCE